MENVNQYIKGAELNDDGYVILSDELAGLKNDIQVILDKVNNIFERRGLQGHNKSQYIIKGICMFYGITESQFKARIRKPNVIDIRRLSAYILRNNTDRSLSQIAKLIGVKANRTILYHVEQVDEVLSGKTYDARNIKQNYTKLMQYLKL